MKSEFGGKNTPAVEAVESTNEKLSNKILNVMCNETPSMVVN